MGQYCVQKGFCNEVYSHFPNESIAAIRCDPCFCGVATIEVERLPMNMSFGPWSSVEELVQAVRYGKVTASEVVEAALTRAVEVQQRLNCFAEIDFVGARAAAAELDRRRARGEVLGPLAGVPVAIKDCTPVRRLGNRLGSLALEHEVAQDDAVIVERFRHCDAIILGKTTLSEFASSSFCDSPLHGITRNPWNPVKTPGGSSGGSAVAVATGCVVLAEGTDMGGSVRIPASCTGTVGLKPAFGRLPIDDQPSFIDDIQHHGILTRTVADLASALPHLCGPTDRDPSSYVQALPRLDVGTDVKGLRIAVSMDLGFFAVEQEVTDRCAKVADHLAQAGAIVTPIRLGWDRSIADGWVRHWHVYLAAFFGEYLDGLGASADPRLMEVVSKGRSYDAVSIKRLDIVRKRQWNVLAEVFRNHDLLLSPTMTRPAVGVEEDDASYHRASDDGRKHGLDMTSVFNWVPWCPAMSVPAGLSLDGLPIGMHLTAPAFREDLALRAASAIEAEYPFIFPPC